MFRKDCRCSIHGVGILIRFQCGHGLHAQLTHV